MTEIVVMKDKKLKYDDAINKLSKANSKLSDIFNLKDTIINDLEASCKKIKECAQHLKQFALRS